MTATTAVATYAAFVATAGLWWQIYLWREKRRHHVEVSVSIAMFGLTDGGTLDVVAVKAVNRGDHNVRISGAGLETQDDSGRMIHFVETLPGADIPGEVPSRDSGTAFIRESEVINAGVDTFMPVVGWVRLGTGELVKSKAKPLMSRS